MRSCPYIQTADTIVRKNTNFFLVIQEMICDQQNLWKKISEIGNSKDSYSLRTTI